MRVLSPTLLGAALLASLPQWAGAVTLYTVFTTNKDGTPVEPTNTDTATGPAYTGYTGLFHHLQLVLRRD